jgi:hypothetical protein
MLVVLLLLLQEGKGNWAAIHAAAGDGLAGRTQVGVLAHAAIVAYHPCCNVLSLLQGPCLLCFGSWHQKLLWRCCFFSDGCSQHGSCPGWVQVDIKDKWRNLIKYGYVDQDGTLLRNL